VLSNSKIIVLYVKKLKTYVKHSCVSVSYGGHTTPPLTEINTIEFRWERVGEGGGGAVKLTGAYG
jgi:hypothetical protein